MSTSEAWASPTAGPTEKERLLAALAGEAADRVPFIGPGGMMTVATTEVMDAVGQYWPAVHTDAEAMAQLGKGMHDLAGFENIGVPFCLTIEAEAMGAPVDLGTKIVEPRITGYPLDSVRDFSRLRAVEPRDDNRVGVLLEAIRLLAVHEDIPITGNLTGPITLATSLVDPFRFAKSMRTEPDAAHALLGFLTDRLIEFGKAQIEAGADVVVIADPSGTGDILGPEMFREFALPYINRIVQGLGDDYEHKTIVHICGRLQPIIPELREVDSNAVSIDSIVSVARLKRGLPGKAIVGNVSTLLLEQGPAGRVFRAGRQCLERGVDILSPACGIGSTTRLEHLRALSMAAKEYRR